MISQCEFLKLRRKMETILRKHRAKRRFSLQNIGYRFCLAKSIALAFR